MVKSRQGGFDPAPGYTPGPRQAIAERPEVTPPRDAEKYARMAGLEIDEDAFMGRPPKTKKPTSAISDFDSVEGYGDLARVLALAYGQAAVGKGKERHSAGKPFALQPIMQIPEGMSFAGGIGGLSYQITKKNGEADRMCDRAAYAAAMKEMLGVINYAAAKYLHIEKRFNDQEGEE